MKHTPGPWMVNVNGSSAEVVTRGRGLVSSFHTGNTHGLANAHLIAAAPDLLEAAKAAFDLLKEYHGNTESDVADLLYYAIRKAEGEVEK